VKSIQKQNEPQEFTDWKNQANENWQPTWDTLRSQVKQRLKEALMAEQGYICCYCEDRLSENDSHIEHFIPQNNPSVDPLDFSNLLCSCQDRLKKGEPHHCGKLKDNWFDEKHLISPLDPTCEERFMFTGDGSIEPANSSDKAAMETIERLGLNIRKLQNLRQQVIDPFLDENLSDKDLEQFVTSYLKQSKSGEFNPFWTTIHYLFKTYIK
jgi:uncharacterized protein (TIGR02646 family)